MCRCEKLNRNGGKIFDRKKLLQKKSADKRGGKNQPKNKQKQWRAKINVKK